VLILLIILGYLLGWIGATRLIYARWHDRNLRHKHNCRQSRQRGWYTSCYRCSSAARPPLILATSLAIALAWPAGATLPLYFWLVKPTPYQRELSAKQRQKDLEAEIERLQKEIDA
jgi:hypothetical protein